MTTQQIILWSCVYLVEFAVVIYFTRATARRKEATPVKRLTATIDGRTAAGSTSPPRRV